MAKKVELPEPIIPNKSWKVVELGNYIKILNGYPFDSDKFTNSSDNKYPLVRIRDVVRGYTETYTNEECPDEYKLKMNDILIGMDGDFNCAKWPNDFGVLNQRVCKISSVSKELDEDFLFYYLPIPLKQINDATPSVTVKHLSSTSLQKLHFPLPTLEEQQRIVNRIEILFAKLDLAKEKAQNVVDTFETRKVSILHKAFTGELTKKWRAENGVGDDSWEEKMIGECCQVKGGKRVPKGMSLIKTPNEHPYLKAGNLKNGTVIDKDMEYVPDDVLKFIKNYTVQTNDLYITNVGACIGDCGIIPEKYNGANLTENAVKLTELNCNNNYLAIQLSSNIVQQQILEKIKSATLGKLSIDNIKQLKINIPSLPEQTEIILILDTILEKETKAKESAEAVLKQIDLLKKSILARAFRGEL